MLTSSLPPPFELVSSTSTPASDFRLVSSVHYSFTNGGAADLRDKPLSVRGRGKKNDLASSPPLSPSSFHLSLLPLHRQITMYSEKTPIIQHAETPKIKLNDGRKIPVIGWFLKLDPSESPLKLTRDEQLTLLTPVFAGFGTWKIPIEVA